MTIDEIKSKRLHQTNHTGTTPTDRERRVFKNGEETLQGRHEKNQQIERKKTNEFAEDLSGMWGCCSKR